MTRVGTAVVSWWVAGSLLFGSVIAMTALTAVPAVAQTDQGPVATLSVNCSSTTELCAPAFLVDVVLPAGNVDMTVKNASECAPVRLHIAFDDKEFRTTRALDFAGGSHGFAADEVVRLPSHTAGRHAVSFQAEGIRRGCDQGQISSWAGSAQFPRTVTVRSTSATAPAFVGADAPPRIGISPVDATFAILPSNASQFDAAALSRPAFTARYPVIDFNPSSEIQTDCKNDTNVDPSTRPLTDVVPQPDGTCQTIPAVGNGHVTGQGDDASYEVAFVGTLQASKAGDVTLSFFSDDGVILGIGAGAAGQPSFVSGVRNNAPARSALRGLPIMGANNVITAPTEEDFKVHFPGAGKYPFELDYFEGAGGQQAVALTSGTQLLGGIVSARAGFASTLAAPSDLSTSFKHLLVNALVVTTFGALVAFPSELFDSTLAEHYDEVASFFDRLRRPFRRRQENRAGGTRSGPAVPPVAIFGAMMAGSALLYGLLDPSFGFSRASAVLFVGLLLGLAVTTTVFNLPSLLYMRIRHGEWGRPRPFPAALPIAVGCVLLSRLAHFHPGYLYGAIAGIAFQAELSEQEEGRAVAIQSVWVLVVSLAAWLLRSPLQATAEQPNPAVVPEIIDVALVTVVIAGLEGLLIGLLPMRFLDGERVRAWSKKAWYVLFGLALVGFVVVLLNPTGGYLSHGSGPAVLTAALCFLAFGALSLSFWAWFRYVRPGPTTPSRPAPPAVPPQTQVGTL